MTSTVKGAWLDMARRWQSYAAYSAGAAMRLEDLDERRKWQANARRDAQIARNVLIDALEA